MYHANLRDWKVGTMVFFVLLLLVIAGIVGVIAWIKWDNKGERIAILVIGGVAFTYALSWNSATSYHNERELVCNVTSKDRGASEGGYRVYTDNCGTLANEDDWFRYKWDSADVWQRIPDRGPVKLRIVGIRAPLFSTFPNVLDAQPVG